MTNSHNFQLFSQNKQITRMTNSKPEFYDYLILFPMLILQ
jgi:hypothetical protein